MVSFTIGQAQADNSIGSPSLRGTAGDHKADPRHSSEVFIEVHRREEERWMINTFEAGDTITLESLGIQFPIEDVYEGTSLTNEP